MSTIGKLAPGEYDPAFLPPVPNIKRPVPPQYNIDMTKGDLLEQHHKNPDFNPPEYFPQPEDYITRKSKHSLGPLDYWATGRTNYSRHDDLTGCRPVVDKYSITRYSLADWRSQNLDLVRRSRHEQNFFKKTEWDAMSSNEIVRARTDKEQADNTKRTLHREKQVFRWKAELEGAIQSMCEEIEFVERQRQRLKKALMMVVLPESIAGESIMRRTRRLEKDLVRDEVEDELAKELSLISEIHLRMDCVLREVERQLLENRGAKQKMEFDWGDKRKAFELEATNTALSNRSGSILFYPGHTNLPSEQSTVQTWDTFVRNILTEAESTRIRSEQLRATLDAVLINAARDLRSQADVVELALLRRIAATEGIYQELHIEIQKIMRMIVDAEDLMPKLKEAIRRMDFPIKTAQTRLFNKSLRPRVENCRDPPQLGLIEEVKNMNESVSELRARLRRVEESHASLLLVRSDLEREIFVKRRSLEVDRGVSKEVRTQYPSVNSLSGYLD